jgi:hypothetical protein
MLREEFGLDTHQLGYRALVVYNSQGLSLRAVRPPVRSCKADSHVIVLALAVDHTHVAGLLVGLRLQVTELRNQSPCELANSYRATSRPSDALGKAQDLRR